jgi:hypothetical protein
MFEIVCNSQAETAFLASLAGSAELQFGSYVARQVHNYIKAGEFISIKCQAGAWRSQGGY